MGIVEPHKYNVLISASQIDPKKIKEAPICKFLKYTFFSFYPYSNKDEKEIKMRFILINNIPSAFHTFQN